MYSFTAAAPLRYLSFIVSKLQTVGTRTLEFPEFGKSLRLTVEVNPRQVHRGRELLQSLEISDLAFQFEKRIDKGTQARDFIDIGLGAFAIRPKIWRGHARFQRT